MQNYQEPVASQEHEESKVQSSVDSISQATDVGQIGRLTGSDDAPPTGGSDAWLQVCGSSLIWLNTMGLMTAFGEFQSFYILNQLSNKSQSDVTWIGSTQISIFLMCGLFSGPLFDMGHLRHLLFMGTFLMVFGIMMTSICTTPWEFVLAQGICYGLGCGLVFIPMIGVITQWFKAEKRGVVNGIASIGAGLGGIMYPIIFHCLQPTVGFGWAIRTMGFVMLVTQLPAVYLLRTQQSPTSPRALFDPTVIRELSFILLFPVAVLTYAAVFIPLIYLSSYGIERHILDPNFGLYLVPIINVATIPGRVIPPIIAQNYTGIINMIFILHVVMGILAFAWQSVSTRAGLVVFSLASGFIGGAGLSMYAMTPIPFIRNPSAIGTRIGMVSVFAGFGVLFGSPVAGILVRNSSSYFGLQSFAGGMMFASALLLLIARLLRTNGKLFAKL